MVVEDDAKAVSSATLHFIDRNISVAKIAYRVSPSQHTPAMRRLGPGTSFIDPILSNVLENDAFRDDHANILLTMISLFSHNRSFWCTSGLHARRKVIRNCNGSYKSIYFTLQYRVSLYIIPLLHTLLTSLKVKEKEGGKPTAAVLLLTRQHLFDPLSVQLALGIVLGTSPPRCARA